MLWQWTSLYNKLLLSCFSRPEIHESLVIIVGPHAKLRSRKFVPVSLAVRVSISPYTRTKLFSQFCKPITVSGCLHFFLYSRENFFFCHPFSANFRNVSQLWNYPFLFPPHFHHRLSGWQTELCYISWLKNSPENEQSLIGDSRLISSTYLGRERKISTWFSTALLADFKFYFLLFSCPILPLQPQLGKL